MYRIGILSGMGPRSTSPFLETVLDECERQYGARFDIDYPHILIYSLPTPFYIDQPMVKDDMLEALKLGIDTLNRGQCDVIAVPCNSVHAYYHEMSAMTSTPLLHIVDETLRELPSGIQQVGLLATRATIDGHIYQRRLAHHAISVHWNGEFQERVDHLINQVKQCGVTDTVLGLWYAIEGELIDKGITEVISGCTDLYFCTEHSRLNIYDSSRMLAANLVSRYVSEWRSIVDRNCIKEDQH